MKKTISFLLCAALCSALLVSFTACGKSRTAQEILEEMILTYGQYGTESNNQVKELLEELSSIDSDAGAKWTEIMKVWEDCDALDENTFVNEEILPDGLPEDDSLCMVALGFQLNKDGTMKEELIERLKVVLACAEKYPNAIIACTGGGTAENDDTVTEAGKMAEWLIEQGIDESRIIVEDESLTTAQNAVNTLEILAESYPQVKYLAIVSSDYHIATGTLFFEAECILKEAADGSRISVTSNAAYKAPKGELSRMFQAGGLIELSGDVDTAFEIYYETYDIHELPKLK